MVILYSTVQLIKLLVKKTKLAFLINDEDKKSPKKANYESVNFYKLVDSVEFALGRNINIDDYTVERWIETINGIKERNAAKANNNNGRKNKQK